MVHRHAWLHRVCPRKDSDREMDDRNDTSTHRPATTCPRTPRVTVSAGDQHAVVLGPVADAFAPVAGPSSAELSSAISANSRPSHDILEVGGNVPSGDIIADNPTRTSLNVLAQDGSMLAQASTVQDGFCSDIISVYENVICWSRNLFNIPLGSAGGDFIDEITRLIQEFNTGTSGRPVAGKAVCVACHLILQHLHNSSLMPKDSEHLRRPLCQWKSGHIMQLFAEGQSIQNRIPDGSNKSSNGHSREKSDITFRNLVFSGKIHSAIRYLSSEPSGGVLDMETVIDEQTGVTVRDALLQKHPQPVEPPESALLADDPQEINPIIYDRITPELIRRIGRQVQGSSGPSRLDADAWCRMLTRYKKSSHHLCSGWYTDNDAAAGTINALTHYWTDIQSRGSGFGYHPNPKKTVLLVKPECEEEVRRIFSPFGVAVTTDGNRHLGGVVGCSGFCETFMKSRVQGWEKDLDVLSTMAQTQPQAAYAVFTKGFASKWTYYLRCSPCAPPLLANLDRAINERWIPALLGDAVCYVLTSLFVRF